MRPPPSTLSDWLQYLESSHPQEIELGLERVGRVAEALRLRRTAPLVISVAGTNGKGSCCALLEALLQAAGRRTGLYTSPHLHRFNERIRIDGEAVSDALLIEAFARIDAARGDISLTYFEFTTLAALTLFDGQALDVLVLEIGLGGRLDAVNLVDADIAVITSIALDHQDWLGSDLDGIAAEKAGILRRGRPLVYGEATLPGSVATRVDALACPLYRRDAEFDYEITATDWHWRGKSASGERLGLAGLPMPTILLENASIALQVLALAGQLPPRDLLDSVLRDFALRGRYQHCCFDGVDVLFDVAHNPAAAARLASRLAQQVPTGPTIAVFAAMADKDIEGMLNVLNGVVDKWVFADLPGVARAAAAEELVRRAANCIDTACSQAADVVAAMALARTVAGADGRILVCGSFMTVAAGLERIESHPGAENEIA